MGRICYNIGDRQLHNEGRTDDIRGDGPIILGGKIFDICGIKGDRHIL